MAELLRHNQAQDFEGRVQAMLRACEKLGLRPYGDSVEANFQRIRAAHPHSVHYGKRAVAQLMAESGCVPNRGAAYELMARGGPAYVPVTDHMRFVGFWDAMEAITKNSLCTLNHLYYSGLDKVDEGQLLLDFKDMGGDALEAMYHRYTREQRWELTMKAEELELMTTAGSDRHDPSRPFMKGYGAMYLAMVIRQHQKHGCFWR
jgi:predicted metal-dependent phosphoesterase TrpH